MFVKATLCAALLALAAAPAASASQRATVKSELVWGGAGSGGGQAQMEGSIESPRPRCLKNRKVRIFGINEAGSKWISADLSSDNGFWGGEGPFADANGVRAKMARKKVGRKRYCSGDTVRFMFPSFPPFPRPASRVTYPTVITMDGSSSGPEEVSGEGSITARRACRENRRVTVSGLSAEGAEFAGFDRASRNGYWGAGGPANGTDGVRAEVAELRIRPGRKCAAASTEYNAP